MMENNSVIYELKLKGSIEWRTLEELKKILEMAIKFEDYELAAITRDYISNYSLN